MKLSVLGRPALILESNLPWVLIACCWLYSLDHLDAFDVDAIELCSRKVASVSGDVRRALQICRRAAEICEGETKRRVRGSRLNLKISISHVNQAVKDLFSSNQTLAISRCSTHEKLLLGAVVLETKVSGDDLALHSVCT